MIHEECSKTSSFQSVMKVGYNLNKNVVSLMYLTLWKIIANSMMPPQLQLRCDLSKIKNCCVAIEINVCCIKCVFDSPSARVLANLESKQAVYINIVCNVLNIATYIT